MKKLAGGVLLVLITSACSGVSPVPIRSGEGCFRCGQPIDDTRLAAQTINRVAANFRTAGCLAKYVADHPNEQAVVFVTDYETGRLMPAAQGTFVPTVNRDNGERDFVVFRNEAVASTEAKARQASTMTWAQVLEQAKNAQRSN